MKNVAVVAVHGVGTHAPHATAEAVEHLLLHVKDGDSSRYTSFHEETFDIQCHPLEPDTSPVKARRSFFNERLPRLRRDAKVGPSSRGIDTPARRLMDGLLQQYRPTLLDAVYESVRFMGKRLVGGTPQANVHVYEMFWSDISAIGSTFWSVFGDFYQLVIHLPYIGLQTIDFAAVTSKHWTALRWLYLWALRAFTCFLPVCNLLMLALCLIVLPLGALSHSGRLWLAAAAIAVGAAATLFYRQTNVVTPGSAWKRFLPFIAPAMVAATPALMRHDWIGEIALQRIVILECWIAVAVVLHHVLRKFNTNRPGAYLIGAVGFILLSASLLYYSLRPATATLPIAAVMYSFEWAYLAAFLSWLVFAIFASGVVVLGWGIAKKQEKLKRAAYTARLALAVPAFVFIAATMLFWGAIYHGAAEQVLPTTGVYESRFCYPALELLRADARVNPGSPETRPRCPVMVPASKFGPAFEGAGASNLGLISAAVVAAAILLLLLIATPSVLAELGLPAGRVDERGAKGLGTWLTQGFPLCRWAGELACGAILLACAATLLVVPEMPSLRWPLWIGSVRAWFGAVPAGLQSLRFGGVLIASGSAVGIVALSKRFTRFGLGLKPALAAALDVDVYFRELPHERTPRARMVARYASLLRYLCHWRESAEATARGYDAIVIVAHSQGTIITADLLRYLRESMPREPALDCLFDDGSRGNGIPVLLLTLGCPLHQLYARRFPNLYDWVTGDDFALPSTTPDVSKLRGVTRWVNLYTSGDYIGRALWQGELEAAYETTPHDLSDQRREACIGRGAHTHYLAATAQQVAEELDALIGGVLRKR